MAKSIKELQELDAKIAEARTAIDKQGYFVYIDGVKASDIIMDANRKIREAMPDMMEHINRLVEALEFYADHKTYEDENGCASTNAKIFYDDGLIANTALGRYKDD